jgi:hypothetical protein
MEQGVGLASALFEFNIETEKKHQEVLELISVQSDSFGTRSSVCSPPFASRDLTQPFPDQTRVIPCQVSLRLKSNRESYLSAALSLSLYYLQLQKYSTGGNLS